MTRVSSAALDKAALLIAARLGIERVAREPIGPEEPEAEPGSAVAIVAALSEGQSQRGEYLMGAAVFEFEHAATFELIVIGGDEESRRARRDDALGEAQAAIAANPTLGGLVDWAELENEGADAATDPRFASANATLTLTYSAPTA